MSAKPSIWETLARGGLQGATAGFEDEAGAGLQALLAKLDGDPLTSPEDVYRQARSENRSANAAAQSAHPVAYTGGQLVGAAVSPLNKLAAGAAPVRAGAFLGGLHAAGNTDATDLGTQALDTATGVAGGAAAGRFMPSTRRPEVPAPGPLPEAPAFADTVPSPLKTVVSPRPAVRASVPSVQRFEDEFARRAAMEADVRNAPKTIADIERIIMARGPMAEPMASPVVPGAKPGPVLGPIPTRAGFEEPMDLQRILRSLEGTSAASPRGRSR